MGAVCGTEHPPLEFEFTDYAIQGGQIIRDDGDPNQKKGARLYDPLCQDNGRYSHRKIDLNLHPQPVGRVECLGVPELGPEVDEAPGGGPWRNVRGEVGGLVQHLGQERESDIHTSSPMTL
jgi:hypothetical protein